MLRRSYLSTIALVPFLASCAEIDNTRPDSGVRPDARADVGADATTADTGVAQDVVSVDARSCRIDDDCTAPDLCTNAQRCMGGRCVVVGGVPSCDDSVSCTDDRCDPMAGRCLHVPNDMRCPSGQFCVEGSGCVAEVPCEIGDTTCQRLNSNACMGTWSCDAARRRCIRSAPPSCDDMNPCTTDTCMPSGSTYLCANEPMHDFMTNPMHCGGCMMACPARANADVACTMGECRWSCQMGAVDSNGDLNAPRGAMSNGCECRTDGMPDVPDLMFRDSNCDGIDGDASRAIFVSPMGSDSNPGTMAQPKRTIQNAVTTAAASSPPRDVYVAAGTYTGQVTLANGVSIYGGYDASTMPWGRGMMNSTTLDSGSTTAVLGSGLAMPVTLQLMTIRAANATAAGASSYGVRLADCSGRVTIEACNVIAGNGADGANGLSGRSGNTGQAGGNGGTGTAGSSGGSDCAPGGRGGQGGTGYPQAGQSGANGTTAIGGVAGGVGGVGGATGVDCLREGRASHGSRGLDGSSGENGLNGWAPASFGTIGSDATYTAPSSTEATPGRHGGGGGGGGESRTIITIIPPSSRCNAETGGGGGGGGGCGGGTAGQNGRSGGGSFPVLVSNTSAVLRQVTLRAGRGGNGGNGGIGGLGAAGGQGGMPGPRSHELAGLGAAGCAGGRGGAAGNGAGGAGGPSICVLYRGPIPSLNEITCTRGGGGNGGTGGANAPVGRAPDGPAGVSEDVRAGS
jgi:hypothetical protein